MSTLMGKAWYATIPLPGARSVPLSVGEVFMLAAVAWLGIIALAAGAHPPLALCGLGAGFAAVFLRAADANQSWIRAVGQRPHQRD